MTLEKAYKIGAKFGFTFNGVGPSLSMIDGKVGICVNLLDRNFGYLRRNFVFDDQKDYEEFLKKYSYYLHNKDKEDLYLVLDNYETEHPRIIYSNELVEKEKKNIESKNKEILLSDMKDFLSNFVASLDEIRAMITEKVLIEQDYYNKLKYYQELLYKSYQMEYKEEGMTASKDIVDLFNKETKEFDLSNKRNLSSLKIDELTFADLNKTYDKLFSDCKKLISDDKWINVFFEQTQFRNNIATLDKMIEYLLKNPISNDETDSKLDEIKTKNTTLTDKEETKKEYENKYLTKYNGVDKDYNQVIFDAPKIDYLEYKKEELKKYNKIADLKEIFDSLKDTEKRNIELIHSPLKPLILYIVEQAYFKNKRFNFDKDEFVKIYELMVKSLKNSGNLVFKLKYFKNVELDTYENFIKSIVKIAKSICNSFSLLPCDLKLYSLNYDACMISASDSSIKNGSDVINVINATKGCSYVYSPIKINISKEDYLFSIVPNNNVLYFPRYLNTSKKEDKVINLSLFEEAYGIEKVKDNNLLIITKFDLDRTVKYKYSTMTGKEKK